LVKPEPTEVQVTLRLISQYLHRLVIFTRQQVVEEEQYLPDLKEAT
jgi:hypothetical protein